MPNTPTIPNFPPQGIQAQLDLLYLYNPDAANKLIAQLEAGIIEIKQVQEEVEKALQDLQGVMRYKGSVQTEADLPTEGNVVGDIWNIISTDENVAWTGTEWDKFGSAIDTSKFLTNNATSAYALAVGKNSSASIDGTAVGSDANAQAKAVVIGWNAKGHGVSIGPNTTSAVDAVQLGEGKNPDTGTFKVGLGQNYELIDSTGHIPLAMLPDLHGVVGAVDSVNGKTGVVVLSGDDISGDVNGRTGTINDLLSGYETKKFSIPYSEQFSIATLKIGTFKKSDAATVFTVTTEYTPGSTEVVSCYLSVDANRIRFYADMFSENNSINAKSISNANIIPMYVDNGDSLDIYVRAICGAELDNIDVTVTHDKKLFVADDLAPDFSGRYPSGYIVASGSVHMSISQMRQEFVASQYYAWPSFKGSAFVPFRRAAGSADMPNSHAFAGVAIPHEYNEFGMVAIDIEDKKLYLYSGKGTEVTPAGWVEVGSAASASQVSMTPLSLVNATNVQAGLQIVDNELAKLQDQTSVLTTSVELSTEIGGITSVLLDELTAMDIDGRPSYKDAGATVYAENGAVGIIDTVDAANQTATVKTVQFASGGGSGGDYLPLSGGTITGDLAVDGTLSITGHPTGSSAVSYNISVGSLQRGLEFGDSQNGFAYYYSFNPERAGFFPRNSGLNLGRPNNRWGTGYLVALNNGADIAIPATGGTMVVATPPTDEGTYTLKATVAADGTVTTAWVKDA